MTLPAGYSLDAPAQAPNQAPGSLPTGYTLDSATPAQAPAATNPVALKKPYVKPTKTEAFIRGAGNIPLLPSTTPAGQPQSNWIPTVGGVVKGLSNLVLGPMQLAEHGIDYLTGAKGPMMTDAPVNAISGAFDKNISGELLGEVAPFLLSGGATSATKLPTAINATRTSVSKLSSLLKPLLAKAPRTVNIIKNTGVGAITAPTLTPEANYGTEDNYWSNKEDEAITGALTGGGLSAAVEAAPLIKKGYTAGKEFVKKSAGIGNPITTTGATIDTIVGEAGKNIDQIRLGAQLGKETDVALLEQVRQAAAKEHGIDLTRANVLDNPTVDLAAKDMAGRRFSVGNDVHIEQGKQIKTAVQNLLKDTYKNGTPAQQQILEDAMAAATEANKSPFNPQTFADFLRDNRNQEALKTAFDPAASIKGPDLNSILGLAEVLKSMPEAGKAAARLGIFEGMGPIRATAKVLSGVSALHTFGVAPALEMAGEGVANRLRSNYLFKPKELKMAPNSSLADIINPKPSKQIPVDDRYFQKFINKGGTLPIVTSTEQLRKLPDGAVYQDESGTQGIKRN